jgi:hypothetical protein
MEVVDKLKLVTEKKKVLELTDREKIMIKVRSVKIDNIDKIIDFSSELLRSPII